MSIALMTLAWKIDAGSTDKLVLLALADWANADGTCWPSIRQLAEKSGLAERGLQMAIKRLCQAGHISRQENVGKGVNYTVHPRTICTPADNAPPHENAQTPARRAPNTLVTVISSTKATPSTKIARAKRKPDALPDWVPEDAWIGFADMRRRTGHPLTPRAHSLILKKLKALADTGQPPGEVLDQSTMNGWRGIFALKEPNHGNPTRSMAAGIGARPVYRSNPALDRYRQLVGDFADDAEADAGASCLHN